MGSGWTCRSHRCKGAPARLTLWWVVLEDGHVSRASAGENICVTLQHDTVVRHYGCLPARVASAGVPWRQTLNAAQNGEGGHKVRLLLVVTDVVTGAPLQAAQLVCRARTEQALRDRKYSGVGSAGLQAGRRLDLFGPARAAERLAAAETGTCRTLGTVTTAEAFATRCGGAAVVAEATFAEAALGRGIAVASVTETTLGCGRIAEATLWAACVTEPALVRAVLTRTILAETAAITTAITTTGRATVTAKTTTEAAAGRPRVTTRAAEAGLAAATERRLAAE